MAFYPAVQAPAKSEVALDYAVEAPGIIALMESGCPSGYKVAGIATGEPLPKAHICGIRLAGRDCPDGMSAVYDRVVAERQACEAAVACVTDKTLQGEYTAELTKACPVVDTTKWLTGMKAVYKVSTWPDLRTKIVESKPVAVAEAPVEEPIEKP
jgi:hypothetical protein